MMVGVNEHLAHLLQIQGGLLDAYLEQNLGARYAYAILVWEQVPPSTVRGVTNCTHPHDLRAVVRGVVATAAREGAESFALERAPLFIDLADYSPGRS